YTSYNGKVLKIWESEVCEKEETSENEGPGTVIAVDKEAIYVRTGENALKITQVQLEGKKRMYVKEFLLGCRIEAGEIFR
ncbi:MAG: methionyl-tRNA formyltransferase, partial [Lachnospiraceae bacterium]|nr:methionyl-tRNA formyltransferase [Lachnospiraceae bacterium]